MMKPVEGIISWDKVWDKLGHEVYRPVEVWRVRDPVREQVVDQVGAEVRWKTADDVTRDSLRLWAES